MKITLMRTGGFIPVIKKATKEVNWSDKEMEELIDSIRADSDAGKMRDSTQYQLIFNGRTFSIDFEKIPLKYKEVFEQLKNNLQIAKPG